MMAVFFYTNRTDCVPLTTREGGKYQHLVQFGAVSVPGGGKNLPARISKYSLCAFQDT